MMEPTREILIDFAQWLSEQTSIDVMVVDEAVDQYLTEVNDETRH